MEFPDDTGYESPSRSIEYAFALSEIEFRRLVC